MVKVIKPEYNHEKGIELIHQEAELLDQLNHRNIIKLKHLIQLDNKLYLGMELARGGSLKSYLASSKTNRISDINASKIMKGILSAVSYMHENGIIHRDLKTANILFAEPHDLSSIKIIDFGFSEVKLHSKASYDDHVGTLLYMAPELAQQHDYTKSVDIWAVGIIMHYVMTGGKHPFYAANIDNSESFKKKLIAIKQINPDKSFSWLAQNMFRKLTTVQAHMRYTAKDAL